MQVPRSSQLHRVDHLEANILTLLVAIQPQYQVVAVRALLGEEMWNAQFWSCLFLLSGTREQFSLKIPKNKN